MSEAQQRRAELEYLPEPSDEVLRSMEAMLVRGKRGVHERHIHRMVDVADRLEGNPVANRVGRLRVVMQGTMKGDLLV